VIIIIIIKSVATIVRRNGNIYIKSRADEEEEENPTKRNEA
jgi:hypothetical protein